jgi:hypothetical protein
MSLQPNQNTFKTAIDIKSSEYNDTSEITCTILKSPFIATDLSSNIPTLHAPSKKNSSPIKRSHKRTTQTVSAINTNELHTRTRKPLSFNNANEKPFNLLDDFQHNNSDEKIDLFSSKFSFLPPQNSNVNFKISSEPDKKLNKIQSRDIFDISNSRISNTDENKSIFSNIPLIGANIAYDFNSYLRSVTSSFKIGGEITKKNTSNHCLLDLSNPIKINLLEEQNTEIINDFDLDCIVRSSVWDSDVETEEEDELDLNLNLQDNKQNDLNIELDQSKLQKNHEVLKYFNQTISNKSSNNSQIPLLYDPINKILNSRKGSIPLRSMESSSNSNIPLKIYSDFEPKVKSPVSSQGSDETLNENDQLRKESIPNNMEIKNIQSNTLLNKNINNDHNNNNNNNNAHIKIEQITKSLPHHHIFVENIKSALKPIPKTLLNMIVESSDGSLEDATKYATEINAQNSQGIPIPEKTTEIVNIPTTGPTINGVKKSAIIRGVRAKATIKKKDNLINQEIKNKETNKLFNTLMERREALIQENQNKKNILPNNNNVSNNNFKGFYSLQEKQQFYKRNIAANNFGNEVSENKENFHISAFSSSCNKTIRREAKKDGFSTAFKRHRVNESTYSKLDNNGRKKVNWAENLEW